MGEQTEIQKTEEGRVERLLASPISWYPVISQSLENGTWLRVESDKRYGAPYGVRLDKTKKEELAVLEAHIQKELAKGMEEWGISLCVVDELHLDTFSMTIDGASLLFYKRQGDNFIFIARKKYYLSKEGKDSNMHLYG